MSASLALFLASAVVAQAPDRDADIFGAPTDTATTATATAAGAPGENRDADIFGAPDAAPDVSPGPAPAEEGETFEGMKRAPAQGILDERLAERSDWLSIGGLTYLWLQYSVVDQDYPETFPLSS